MFRVSSVLDGRHFAFVRHRFRAFALSGALVLLTLASLAGTGLNFGIDFAGGVLIEAVAPAPVEPADLRRTLADAGFAGAQIQRFGGDDRVMIRLGTSDLTGLDAEKASAKVRETLGPGYRFDRVEAVGPAVSAELLEAGIVASTLAVLAIAAYVWLRFEWQFGIAALVATAHDVLITVGLMSVTGLGFDLAAIAALLTLAGYSINDTIVVFDRIRETLRRHKTMPMGELIDRAVNDTLTRTIATSGTTLLAVLPLLLIGGPVLLGFSAAIFFGIVIGTYSSIYVAASLLLHLPPLRREPPAEVPAVS